MIKLFVFLTVALAAAQAVSFFQVAIEEWSLYKLKHGKIYSEATEEKFRMKIYNENKHKIALHNQLYVRGLQNYTLAMNEYGDLLHHEFVTLMNGFKIQNNSNSNSEVTSPSGGSTYLSPANVVAPDEVDWRTEGYVTEVKNQGQCGSCWAFSTTGALEGQHFRNTKKLVSLSEQNLVDCSQKYGNEGCNGGLMDNAFQYIKDNGGIDTEKAYPYKGEGGRCKFSKSTVGATDTGYIDLPSGDEQKLKEAVATVGPVSIAIDAGHESFQFYSTGVYYEPHCSSTELDHGVLIVGYGSDNKGGDFWIVKNSWGVSWGEKGFVRMARNKQNQCGVATQASYPLV